MVLDNADKARIAVVEVRAFASNCAAWLIAERGLRISCAMLAVKRPSEASFKFCAR